MQLARRLPGAVVRAFNVHVTEHLIGWATALRNPWRAPYGPELAPDDFANRRFGHTSGCGVSGG
jgi:hypothetical protein